MHAKRGEGTSSAADRVGERWGGACAAGPQRGTNRRRGGKGASASSVDGGREERHWAWACWREGYISSWKKAGGGKQACRPHRQGPGRHATCTRYVVDDQTKGIGHCVSRGLRAGFGRESVCCAGVWGAAAAGCWGLCIGASATPKCMVSMCRAAGLLLQPKGVGNGVSRVLALSCGGVAGERERKGCVFAPVLGRGMERSTGAGVCAQGLQRAQACCAGPDTPGSRQRAGCSGGWLCRWEPRWPASSCRPAAGQRRQLRHAPPQKSLWSELYVG